MPITQKKLLSEQSNVNPPQADKPTSKNISISVALIGALATIIAAVIGSPALASLVNPTPTLTPTMTLTPTPDPLAFTDSDPVNNKISMRKIDAGEFTMGDGKSGNVIHKVSLETFYIDTYEVTNHLYKACVAAGKCSSPEALSEKHCHGECGGSDYFTDTVEYYEYSKFNDFPVISVNWEQAYTYCAWRNARLPTEAEWEKAARGTDGRLFPWGDGLRDDFANINYSIRNATKGGDFPMDKSPYGVYDMAGNVGEWVNSIFQRYPYIATDGRENPKNSFGTARVIRGGNWYSEFYRITYREYRDYGSGGSSYGFRCAKSLE